MPITEYKIYIKAYNGSFIIVDVINGKDTDLLTNRYCKVSADYLARIPFNLKEGTLIVAIV